MAKKVRFQSGGHRLQLTKEILELLKLGLKEAKDAVDAGEVECPDDKYDALRQAITEAGGTIIEEAEPENMNNVQFDSDEYVGTDDGINEVFVMSKDSDTLVVESRISISMRLYEHLLTCNRDKLRIMKQHVPLVVEFRQILSGGSKQTNVMSVLAICVPRNHNSVSEIITLATTARMIHEMELKAASTIIILDSIGQDLKPFYDE